MPQMMPMLWIMMLMLTMIMMTIIITLLYFSHQPLLLPISSFKTYNYWNWSW